MECLTLMAQLLANFRVAGIETATTSFVQFRFIESLFLSPSEYCKLYNGHHKSVRSLRGICLEFHFLLLKTYAIAQ